MLIGEEIMSYFKGIEEKLIEIIDSAEDSIYIAVAWFTSNNIKNTLIDKAKTNPRLIIKIIVDDNEINEKYFFNSLSLFVNAGIQTKKVTTDFLHSKFLLVDNELVVTGSYNFSKKAIKNIENILVIRSRRLYSNYLRVFKFLYDVDYIDDNITLLFKYSKFAKNLLSTYYQFSKHEFIKYEDKIEFGDCYSYFNGFNDQLSYYPGLIFNKAIKYKKLNTTDILGKNYFPCEFELPVNKKIVKNWIKSNNINNTIESFRGHENLYHLINDELEEVEKMTENYFKRKIDNCYSSQEMEQLILKGVDIVIEDELWKTNFEPFLNKDIVERIFCNIRVVKYFE